MSAFFSSASAVVATLSLLFLLPAAYSGRYALISSDDACGTHPDSYDRPWFVINLLIAAASLGCTGTGLAASGLLKLGGY